MPLLRGRGAPDLLWLNRIVMIAKGRRAADSVTIEAFEIL
jgi:hypothetical protein